MKGKGLLAAVLAMSAALFLGLGAGVVLADEAPSAEAATGAAAEAKSPKLEATPDSFDFGTVEEGEKPMAVFTLKNTGGSELVIYDAKPSCGCTLAKLSSKQLMPGETATLEAVYNSHNARGGKVSKYVTVKTNDPKNPSKVLRITGEVKAKPAAELRLSQYRVDNLNLTPGAVEKRKVQLSNSGQMELDITEMTTTQGISAKLGKYEVEPGKTVKMQMALQPGEAMEMDVEIAPKQAAKGNFQELITIRSNSKGRAATSYLARGVIQ